MALGKMYWQDNVRSSYSGKKNLEEYRMEILAIASNWSALSIEEKANLIFS